MTYLNKLKSYLYARKLLTKDNLSEIIQPQIQNVISKTNGFKHLF